MEADVGALVNETGLCVPLAAQLMAVISRSGATQMEIDTALNLVQHLRHHLKGSLVNEELAASWAPSSDVNFEAP
jgi:hypothetical protein